MKKLTFLIWLLMTGQALAYGSAKEDTSTAITFVHSIGMDSVRYYAGQDTTSWEINRLMVRAFAEDSTNYALIDTFDNPGTYFVKIVYWEGGVDSSGLGVLPDIRHVAPANANVNIVSVDARAITLAAFDTATVAAYYGFTIWVDDGAANTNATVGIDGTLANPVSTLTAARILADSMDIHQYNILNASSFTLAATHENWIFLDVGHNGTIDLGSQDVDNSTFIGLDITGTQGGTGTISLFDCDITDLHDFDGEALFCWLVDSLVMDNNSDAFFGNCYSSVAGNVAPKIDFHIASNNIAFRNYSGGINIVNMSSNDNISIEGNGQIIVDATCSNAPITARGNFSIIDNGSGTVWTDDAVYNKGYVADTVWTPGVITSTIIATDAIGASQIGTDAIGSDQLKDGAITSTQLAASALGVISDTMVELLLRKKLTPGYPLDGDTVSALLYNTGTIITYTDGDGSDGIDGVLGIVQGDVDVIRRTVLPHLGYIDDATPTSSQFVVSSAIAAYGDDFFNELYLTFITGVLKGRAEEVIDFDGTDDTIYVNTFFSTPANLDSFVIASKDANLTSWLGTQPRGLESDSTVQATATATISDADKGDIADSIFLRIVANDTTSGGTDTIFADYVVSTALVLGKDGISTSHVSLHMKVGGYSGAAGDDNNIKDDIAAIAAPGGSGAFSCSLHVLDGASAITSGSIRMISGVNEYVLPIDANGWVEFSLDGGTWTAYATALRFIQDTIPQTIIFSTHHVDTITMSAFSPSTPTDTGKVVLYVWTDRILGDTLEGATFRVIPLDKGKNWVTGGNRIILTGEVTVKTDSTGYAEVEVYQSSYTHPYPSGSDSLKYNISVTYPGLGYWAQARFVAPDTGSQYQIGVLE